MEDVDFDETDQHKLSNDDQPGWLMDTLTKTIPQLKK